MRYGQYLETPIGKLFLVAEDGCLVELGIQADGSVPEMGQVGWQEAEVLSHEKELLMRATGQIQEYLAGKRTSFDIPICGKGSEFQKKVWKALCEIPYGETRTYGQIAVAIGNPKAARAVGGACNKNPIMIIVPCHRVIGGNGKLVGFGGGLDMKEKLLTLEGIEAKEAVYSIGIK